MCGYVGVHQAAARSARAFKVREGASFPRGRSLGWESAVGRRMDDGRAWASVSSFPSSFSTATMHGSPSPRGAAARRGRSPRTVAHSPAPSSLPPDFSIRGPATFTSCLTIPVEGAISIERPEPTTAADAPAPTDSNKRAPRKSKTDALAALHTHTQSTLSEEALIDSQDDVGIRIQLRDGPPIPVPAALNISTLKTPSARPTGVKPTPRPFGLADCPTFHPTPEQFKDPMEYISSISSIAKRFGMCKIVPPADWNMPFVTDTEVRLRVLPPSGLPIPEALSLHCFAYGGPVAPVARAPLR